MTTHAGEYYYIISEVWFLVFVLCKQICRNSDIEVLYINKKCIRKYTFRTVGIFEAVCCSSGTL